jgi:hypothetical protein
VSPYDQAGNRIERTPTRVVFTAEDEQGIDEDDNERLASKETARTVIAALKAKLKDH